MLQALVMSAGIDPIEDSRIRGYLQGLNAFFDIEPEDTNQDEVSNEEENDNLKEDLRDFKYGY